MNLFKLLFCKHDYIKTFEDHEFKAFRCCKCDKIKIKWKYFK